MQLNTLTNVARGTDLSFIQRCDHCAVAELGLAYHRLRELHLCCDVGHRYGVVVIVGDVQGALVREGQLDDISHHFTAVDIKSPDADEQK